MYRAFATAFINHFIPSKCNFADIVLHYIHHSAINKFGIPKDALHSQLFHDEQLSSTSSIGQCCKFCRRFLSLDETNVMIYTITITFY